MSKNYLLPNEMGYFGSFGGRFVPEVLMPAITELSEAYYKLRDDSAFMGELDQYLLDYVGRPTPLYHAPRLGKYLGMPRLYLKREDLCHTGAHKINNAIGQALLSCFMGKKRVIAETGAGQHGVAVATAAALLGLECAVYMGADDMARQEPNVYRMKLLGAEVRPVESGSRTLKEAINEAMREWIATIESTHYIIGSVVGPHPYPLMVREFQSVIGKELKKQKIPIFFSFKGYNPDFDSKKGKKTAVDLINKGFAAFECFQKYVGNTIIFCFQPKYFLSHLT